MQNNQEAEFRDWVSKINYPSLVRAFHNSCGLKKQIISEEVDRRFKIGEHNYYVSEIEKASIFNTGITGISPESLQRRLNRKSP